MAGTVRPAPIGIDKEALAGFLDTLSFDLFCTFTTRLPISLGSTRRIAQNVCKHVGAPEFVSVFWCAEQFDIREGFHFHALMKGSIDKLKVFDWYYRRYGRCQLIDNREPDRQLAASHYVSKYITKEITDYDMILCRDHGFQSAPDTKLTRFDRTFPLAAAAEPPRQQSGPATGSQAAGQPLDPAGIPLDPDDCPF